MVRLMTLYLAAGVEVGVAVIVGFAACEAIVRAMSGLFKRQTSENFTEEIRLGSLAGWRSQSSSNWRRTSYAR